jgi:hypothetical protein
MRGCSTVVLCALEEIFLGIRVANEVASSPLYCNSPCHGRLRNNVAKRKEIRIKS